MAKPDLELGSRRAKRCVTVTVTQHVRPLHLYSMFASSGRLGLGRFSKTSFGYGGPALITGMNISGYDA